MLRLLTRLIDKETFVASEINAVTIYEIDGVKYLGPRKILVKNHPRFLSFITLSIGNQVYSLAVDDLVRAIDRAITQPAELADKPSELQSA
jgi:hypothetical protein